MEHLTSSGQLNYSVNNTSCWLKLFYNSEFVIVMSIKCQCIASLVFRLRSYLWARSAPLTLSSCCGFLSSARFTCSLS